MDCHVTVMWLPCDCRVTTMWLSCDYYHVTTVMWLHNLLAVKIYFCDTTDHVSTKNLTRKKKRTQKLYTIRTSYIIMILVYMPMICDMIKWITKMSLFSWWCLHERQFHCKHISLNEDTFLLVTNQDAFLARGRKRGWVVLLGVSLHYIVYWVHWLLPMFAPFNGVSLAHPTFVRC